MPILKEQLVVDMPAEQQRLTLLKSEKTQGP